MSVLGLHEAIAGAGNGGVGPGVSPKTALSVGLKVDSEALPGNVQRALRTGALNLDDPAVTLELLRLNAVVGLTGFFDSAKRLKSIGIQCALCHSVVDNSFAPGIGRRLDGWANRDLNEGLWTHTRGGFYHDGRFATLADVIQHYDRLWSLGLSDSQRADLEANLRSL